METKKLITSLMGPMGKMISGSKSGYGTRHPNNITVFNANLVMNGEKVWFGDIDITLERANLIKLAQESGVEVFVLREMDGRFENENKPKASSYFYCANPDGTDRISESYKEFYNEKTMKRES